MKKVLITGASGFIGRHCLTPLLEKGFEVHALALHVIPEYKNDVVWHCQNFLHHEKTHSLIKDIQPSHCLHLAWYTEPGKYWSSPENLPWTASSISLLHSFQQQGGTRFVGAGTCAEYDWRYGHCSEAVTPLEPATLYGTCKNVLQKTLAAFSESTSLSSAWGRLFFLYGDYEHPARLVPTIINSLLQNEKVHLSHGNQIRDFLHVSDAANALVCLLESDVTGSINIASGIPIMIRDMALKIADKINDRGLLNFGAITAGKDEPGLLTAEVVRLKQEVGFSPAYSIEAGLEKTIVWWKKQNKLG